MLIILNDKEPNVPADIFVECHGVVRMLPEAHGFKFYVLRNEGVPDTVHPLFEGMKDPANEASITLDSILEHPKFIFPLEEFDHVFREHDTLQQKRERAIMNSM